MSALKGIKSAYRISIKGIVTDNDGKLLLVRERSESWDLPGGGLEHGGLIFDNLKREFQEELAVGIADKEPIFNGAYPTWNTKFDDPVFILAYKIQIIGEPSATEDVQEFKYFSLEDAKKANLDSTILPIIDKFYVN